MKIYNYSPLTGEFISAVDADESPLEEGQFLIPAEATTVAPPSAVQGKANVFAAGAWSQVEDHRGEVFYDETGLQVTITALGPVPETLTVAPPPAAMAAEVTTFRDTRLAAGFDDAATGKKWQCDDRSQGKWTAVGASALASIVLQTNPAPTFELIAADNSTITLSAADALALTNGRLLPWVSATMLYARSLKDQITAGTPPADITAGWPANAG